MSTRVTAIVRERLRLVIEQSFFRNSLLLMVNYGVTAGLGFLFWIVAARLFPTESIGNVSAIISGLTLTATAAALGLPNTVIKFLAHDPRQRLFFARACVGVASASLLLGCVVIAVPGGLGIPLRDVPPFHVSALLFVVALVMFAVGMIADAAIIARMRTGGIVVKNAAASVLRIALLPVIYSAGTIGLFASFILSSSVATVASVVMASNRLVSSTNGRTQCDQDTPSGKVVFTVGNYTAMLISILPTTTLPIIVLNRLGASAAAYVAMPLLIIAALNAIPGTVAQSLFAELSASGAAVRQSMVGALKWLYLLLIPAIGLVCLMGGSVLSLFGEEYARQGTTALRLMAVAAVFGAFNYVADVALNSAGKVGWFVFVNTAGTVVLLGMCFMLVRFGITGVGVGWLVGQVAYALLAALALMSLLTQRRRHVQ